MLVILPSLFYQIYEIPIILVNVQQIIDIQPIIFPVGDHICEFVRFGHQSIFWIV
jgi:hypothetical protein